MVKIEPKIKWKEDLKIRTLFVRFGPNFAQFLFRRVLGGAEAGDKVMS